MAHLQHADKPAVTNAHTDKLRGLHFTFWHRFGTGKLFDLPQPFGRVFKMAQRAASVAERTLRKVYKKVGFVER